MMTKTRRGMSLITAMAVMMIISILGMGIITLALSSVRTAHHRRNSQGAFNLAEAGVTRAKRRLAGDPAHPGSSGVVLGDGTFSVSISTPAGEPDRRLLLATGRMQNLDGQYVERSVTELVRVGSNAPMWDHAVFAQKDLEIRGNPSFGSTPMPNEGHIHANRDIQIKGTPTINGETTASDDVDISGQPKFSSPPQENQPEVAFKLFDEIGTEAAAAANGTTSGDTLLETPGPHTLRGRYTGKLEIKHSVTVILDGPVWFQDEIVINGSVTMGDGLLVTEKKLTITGSGITGSDALTLVSTYGSSGTVAVEISGAPTIRAGIYAYPGKIKIVGASYIIGTLAARDVCVLGNVTVQRNLEFSPAFGVGSGVTSLYWRGQ